MGNMLTKSFGPGRLIAVAVFAVASLSMRAQGVLPGSGDASFNVGFSNLDGVDNNKHISYGGSAGANLSGRMSIVGEYNYLPMGSLTQSGVTANEKIQQFGGAVRIPLSKSEHAVPYLVVGGGFDRLTASASASGVNVSASQSGGYFGAGGGVNLFVGRNWGFRPEFRWERQQFGPTSVAGVPVAGGGLNDVRGTVSLFYRWGGRKPKQTIAN
jgi:hypothetical protein